MSVSTPEPAPPSPQRGRVLRPILFLFLFFAVGLGLGWGLRMAWHPGDETADHPPHVKQSDALGRDGNVELGDQWLREGNYALALANYREASGSPHGLLRYRIALCLEGLGNNDKALGLYRQVVADESVPRAHVAAQLAQARLLLRMGRHDEVRQLLYPLHLAIGRQGTQADLLVDARYLLAIALARNVPTPPSRIATWLASASTVPGELTLDLPDPSMPDARDAAEEPLTLKQVLRGGEWLVIRARLPRQPARAVLDALAARAGLKISWTPAAEVALQERTLLLDLEKTPLADLLPLLADALDLVSWREKDLIHFATASEVPAERMEAGAAARAERALLAALAAREEHPLAPLAALHVARIELAADRPDEALQWYEKVRIQAPASFRVVAAYNRGLVLGERGNTSAARAAFQEAIDQAPGHALAATAYFHIGRLLCEEGQVRASLPILRRARMNYPGAESQPALALLSAIAHLQAEGAEQAHQVLLDQRRALQGDRYRASAAFLDATALLRLAKQQGGSARREASELVAALGGEPSVPMLGPLEGQVRGQVYRDLGMWQEAARVYQHILPELRGALVAPTQVAYAECLFQLHRDAEALALLSTVAAGDPGRVSAAAALRLAEVELEQGQNDECLRRCRQLWDDRQLAETDPLLRIWGAAYERLGDYASAARCFSGSPP